jgi:hypothetical protein
MNKSSAGVYRHDTLALPPIIGQQRTCGQEESRVPDIQQSVEMSFYREHWITYEYAHRTHYIFVPECDMGFSSESKEGVFAKLGAWINGEEVCV